MGNYCAGQRDKLKELKDETLSYIKIQKAQLGEKYDEYKE